MRESFQEAYCSFTPPSAYTLNSLRRSRRKLSRSNVLRRVFSVKISFPSPAPAFRSRYLVSILPRASKEPKTYVAERRHSPPKSNRTGSMGSAHSKQFGRLHGWLSQVSSREFPSMKSTRTRNLERLPVTGAFRSKHGLFFFFEPVGNRPVFGQDVPIVQNTWRNEGERASCHWRIHRRNPRNHRTRRG